MRQHNYLISGMRNNHDTVQAGVLMHSLVSIGQTQNELVVNDL